MIKKPLSVVIYSKKACYYCDRAKSLLQNKKIPYEEILIDGQADLYNELKAKTGHMTVPQIFINNEFIGGYAELRALDEKGELEQ